MRKRKPITKHMRYYLQQFIILTINTYFISLSFQESKLFAGADVSLHDDSGPGEKASAWGEYESASLMRKGRQR